SIPEMFVAAIVPGLLLAASFVAVNLVMNRNKKEASAVKYSRKEVMESFIQAVPVLLLPVIILGGIYTGIFKPTEAAVTCVIYSMVLGIAYREMKFSDLISAMKK
ncbi:TRAP transporter large permease subunit, partial [[Clostridium] symbiosum]|uniref:TRAP transporter large permease subunit n=1 Tax=Clostridium symbiosum TaxID=1512 RepID=UPI00210D4FC2